MAAKHDRGGRRLHLGRTLEESAVGRALISVGVVATVLAVLVVNMPESHVRADLLPVVAPYLRMTGLDQNWGVFAPPRTISAYVEGRVTDADGRVSVVTLSSPPGIPAYADYRWQKFGERLRLDANQRLWAPYARFLADQARAEGRRPVAVALVRRWASTRPPGPGPQRDPWQEFTFFAARA
jgi:hypothetical protein